MSDGMTEELSDEDRITKCSVRGCKEFPAMIHEYKGYCFSHYEKFVKSGQIKEPKKVPYDG